MDVIVTFEDDLAESPCLSLLQLRGLFEDHPTFPLVRAMCEQVRELDRPGDLVRAMYSMGDETPPEGINELEWFEDHVGWRHKMMLEVGVKRWLNA